MEKTFIAIIMAFITTGSVLLAHILSISLPEISRLFDRKPFNCRPCFTFHLIWIFSVLTTFLLKDILILIAGIIMAFAVFSIIKFIENKRIIK